MPEIADIFKSLVPQLGFLSTHERKAVGDTMCCRTEKLGGNSMLCDTCGHTEVHYNSCRNRHCPKCQNLSRMKWVSEQLKRILPVSYFHAVFTIPDSLKLIALYNKRIIYNLLFRSVHRTLSAVAKRKDSLGFSVGGISVLHTWNQKLGFHPHIHCIIPGAGRDPDGRFRAHTSRTFFLPVKKLSVVFRGIFLKGLGELFASGKLKFAGSVSGLADPRAFYHQLKQSCSNKWVVYLKKPFGGPAKVFQYLGKYTHRVGISNRRIVSFENNSVVFSYLDRKDGNSRKLLTLDAFVFAKRFILHILPRRFVKIRYFGFLANCIRKKLIPVCKESLGRELGFDSKLIPVAHEIIALTEKYSRKEFACPHCANPMRRTHIESWMDAYSYSAGRDQQIVDIRVCGSG
jgi:hypothetical protein